MTWDCYKGPDFGTKKGPEIVQIFVLKFKGLWHFADLPHFIQKYVIYLTLLLLEQVLVLHDTFKSGFSPLTSRLLNKNKSCKVTFCMTAQMSVHTGLLPLQSRTVYEAFYKIKVIKPILYCQYGTSFLFWTSAQLLITWSD